MWFILAVRPVPRSPTITTVTRSADWTDTDALIASALQLNGRAPWGVIARALALPERTVARRGQALLDSGAVKVSTYLDTTRVGSTSPLLVHLKTRPGFGMAAASILAEHADASSVSVLEAADEIVAMLIPRGPQARESFLFDELASIEGLVSSEISTVLHYFRSGYDWYSGELDDSAVALLRSGLPTTSDEPFVGTVELSEADEELIALLAEDGRATTVALATQLGASAPTVRKRLEWLFAAGMVHVRTEAKPTLHGLRVEALTWLRVPADEIHRTGIAMGKLKSVRFCVASTGHSQLLVDCLVADEQELYTFLTRDVGINPAARIAQSSVVLRAVRRGPMVITGRDNVSDLVTWRTR